MGKHFVNLLLLISRRILKIKMNPTAAGCDERRWIELAQELMGFGINAYNKSKFPY
jgi:metal-sulfur cluster biosynthetic enzyme